MDGGIEADNTGPRCRRPALAEFYLGTSAQPGAWRWGSGLGAPTREGTPKHATGTCAGPSQLRASEVRLRGALACTAPSAPTPSATITCADPPSRNAGTVRVAGNLLLVTAPAIRRADGRRYPRDAGSRSPYSR